MERHQSNGNNDAIWDSNSVENQSRNRNNNTIQRVSTIEHLCCHVGMIAHMITRFIFYIVSLIFFIGLSAIFQFVFQSINTFQIVQKS